MEEKFALVLGASSGLGNEICHYLLSKEYVVFGVSRTGADFDHVNYIDIKADLKEGQDVDAVYSTIRENTFVLDLVVNGAAICKPSQLEETSESSFLEHLQVNTVGAFLILKQLKEFLMEYRTHIIHISSISGKKGYAEFSAYCASKFALQGLIECAKAEWKEEKVKFTTLCPGEIDTPIWDKMGISVDRNIMLKTKDFMHVFSMVEQAPWYLQFEDLVFYYINQD